MIFINTFLKCVICTFQSVFWSFQFFFLFFIDTLLQLSPPLPLAHFHPASLPSLWPLPHCWLCLWVMHTCSLASFHWDKHPFYNFWDTEERWANWSEVATNQKMLGASKRRKRQRRALHRGFRGSKALLAPWFRIWIPESWDNKFLLFEAIPFVVLY